MCLGMSFMGTNMAGVAEDSAKPEKLTSNVPFPVDIEVSQHINT